MGNSFPTQTEMSILRILREAPEGLSGHDIVSRGVSEGSVYTLLARLDRKGFVQVSRVPSPYPGLSRSIYKLSAVGVKVLDLDSQMPEGIMDTVRERSIASCQILAKLTESLNLLGLAVLLHDGQHRWVGAFCRTRRRPPSHQLDGLLEVRSSLTQNTQQLRRLIDERASKDPCGDIRRTMNKVDAQPLNSHQSVGITAFRRAIEMGVSQTAVASVTARWIQWSRQADLTSRRRFILDAPNFMDLMMILGCLQGAPNSLDGNSLETRRPQAREGWRAHEDGLRLLLSVPAESCARSRASRAIAELDQTTLTRLEREAGRPVDTRSIIEMLGHVLRKAFLWGSLLILPERASPRRMIFGEGAVLRIQLRVIGERRALLIKQTLPLAL